MQGLVWTRPPSRVAPEGDADEVDETALVARAALDPQAFAQLYRRYLDPVYRYCYHRLGTREAAEDATSQIFTKALAALPSHRPDRPFRSWLFAIAHNVVADVHRGRHVDQPLDAAAEVADAAATPEEQAIAAEAARTVQALLAGLTPDQARVVELRLAGLTEVEIARVLGRRPGAVRAVQFRALVRLRSLLGVGPAAKGVADAS